MPEVRDLTVQERQILELVINNAVTIGRYEALEQLKVARHGGVDHLPDVCIDIELPPDVVLIPDGNDVPVWLSARPHGQVIMSDTMLWITDGRISYLELSELSEPDIQVANTQWPDLSDYVL
jgi:hypothetical protein